MANVVIAFTGNVCSTPMIEYPRLTETVFVPLREHFDEERFREVTGAGDNACTELADTLAALYRRETTGYLNLPALVKYRGRPDIPDVRTEALATRTRFFFQDVEGPRKIVAEDIFKPQIDYDAFNAVLGLLFGAGTSIAKNDEAKVRKGGLDMSNCRNPEKIHSAPDLARGVRV